MAKSFDGHLYLTCRKNDVGENLTKQFNEDGYTNVKFHHLDVTCNQSIDKFIDFISKNYDGIDLLIHNAGITSVSIKKYFNSKKNFLLYQ